MAAVQQRGMILTSWSAKARIHVFCDCKRGKDVDAQRSIAVTTPLRQPQSMNAEVE
jgi:hypothetical protein